MKFDKNDKNYNNKKNVFGIRLQALRKMQSLTTIKLAEIINVPSSSISRWENGINYPTIETLRDLSKYFDVSTDYLLGLVNFAKPFHSESESYFYGEESVSISMLNEDEKMLIKAMIKVLTKKEKKI